MATELREREAKKNDRKERDRRNRMFWLYVGYIMALEDNGLDKTEDALQKKRDANEYGHCYQV